MCNWNSLIVRSSSQPKVEIQSRRCISVEWMRKQHLFRNTPCLENTWFNTSDPKQKWCNWPTFMRMLDQRFKGRIGRATVSERDICFYNRNSNIVESATSKRNSRDQHTWRFAGIVNNQYHCQRLIWCILSFPWTNNGTGTTSTVVEKPKSSCLRHTSESTGQYRIRMRAMSLTLINECHSRTH